MAGGAAGAIEKILGGQEWLERVSKECQEEECVWWRNSRWLRRASASALGLAEDAISSEELEEALDYAAQAATRSAMKACSKLTSATDKSSCKTSAQAKAAATMGLETITSLDFAEFTDAGAFTELRAAAKACAEAGTSSSACDFQGTYDAAAGTDSSSLSSDVKATSARSNGRDAARNLIKQNLKSCSQSTNSAGGTRSAAEIVSCSQGIENSTFSMLEDSTRTDKSLRDAIRELAAERMKSCMSLSSASSTDCETKALAVMQTYSADTLTAADLTDALLVSLSGVYTNVYGAIGGVGCSTADTATCSSSAASSATLYGSSSNGSAIDLGFNALRKTADTWCSCEDTSSNATECEVQAKAQYVKLGGNPAEWETTQRDQTRDLATGYCNGNMTTIFRMDSTDLVFTLAAACSTLDTTAVEHCLLGVRCNRRLCFEWLCGV